MTRGIVIASVVAMFSLWSTPMRADTAKVAADTYVNANTPVQNNGNDATISVRNIGAGGIRQGFVRFDLSTVAPNIHVSRATLRLWVADVDDPGSIEVRLASGPWQEQTLTAATAPEQGPLLATKAISLLDRRKFVTVDITSAVADWLSGASANTGLVIAPSPADKIRVEFDTKENANTSHPADLEIASAADITSVTAGPGLTGGGASGDVTVGLRTDCAAGTMLKWDGGSWACAAIPVGGGTVTQVDSGVGLAGGPITGTGTLHLDTAYTDARYLPRNMAFTPGSAITVDCDAGQTITSAVEGARAFGRLGVTVLGTCRESVQIMRADTYLYAGPAGATIEAPTADGVALWADGMRVTITGLTVKGQLHIRFGAYVTVSSSRVTGSGRDGIFVNGGTLVLQGSTVDAHQKSGVRAGPGSTVLLSDSTIENNGLGASLEMTTAVVDRCRIRNNPRSGLFLFFGSTAQVLSSTIENNGHAFLGAGIEVTPGARLNLGLASGSGPNVIRGNVEGIVVQSGSLATAGGEPFPVAIVSESSDVGVDCFPPTGNTALLVGLFESIAFENNGNDTTCPGF